jgi:hypothetical protein
LVKVNQYFDVVYGTNCELVHLTPDPNGINFVARTSKNNGVITRVKIISGIEPNPANTISVAASGSVMESFLQKEPYYSGRDLFYLKPRIKLSDKQLLFYCMCLKANRYKYNYGRQANKTLPELKIPSIGKIPTWVGTFSIPKKPKIDSATDKYFNLNIDRWRWFCFDDLFDIERGESKYIVNLKKGNIPYVSATSNNNGISYYVKARNNEGNKITLSYDGTIGEAFYQKGDFFASEKIAVLKLKKKELNPYLAMFLITVIRRESSRYNYGYKWSIDTRMKKTKIKLPSDNDRKPDWKFMENYIKSLPYSSNL